jgi:phage-related protein
VIFLDGFPISKWGLQIQKEHEHPATPDIRRKTMTIPGMPGEWDFGAEIGSRPFNFPVGFIEYDPIQKQRRLREFVAFLFDENAKPREMKLSFDYEPEKYYLVKVPNSFTPQRIPSFAFFALPLIASKPFAYADLNAFDPVDVPNFGEASGEDYYPNTSTFSWIYNNHYSGVHNYSSLKTDFIVTIEGTVANPSITHLETSKKLILPSITNQKLEIDSSRFTMKVNSISRLSGTDFFSLISEDNSLLFEGENPNAKVTYKWKHKFL